MKKWIKKFFSIWNEIDEVVDTAAEALANEKEFTIKLKTTKETKMRPLKAAIETAVMDALAKSNPEVEVKSVRAVYKTNV